MQPDYWLQASAELAARDRTMATLVEQFVGLSLASRGDPFSTLVRSIVGQQISVKAADSVWARFVDRVGEVRPRVPAISTPIATTVEASKDAKWSASTQPTLVMPAHVAPQ